MTEPWWKAHVGPKKQRKVGGAASPIVQALPLACADEDAAAEFLERMRWGDHPACQHCGDLDVYQMRSRTGERNARYLWRCRGCKQQFTVRHNTVMQDSPIPLRHWCYAFWAACASKKGVSALQIQRQTGLSYKSAHFLLHRVRFAMAHPNAQKLDGAVEADLTYVGGKPRPRNYQPRKNLGGPRKRYHSKKTPVLAVVQRYGGEVRATPMTRVNSQTIAAAIRERVKQGHRLITDEDPKFHRIGWEYCRSHDTVHHSSGEYARGEIHTNTIESFFALIKRGVYGTYHSVSKKHLHRYVAEFAFRYNHRHMDDGARTQAAIRGAQGKRLLYREQAGSPDSGDRTKKALRRGPR